MPLCPSGCGPCSEEKSLARVTIEDCLTHCTDHFALVHLTTLRFRQLHRGASRLVESRNKDIVTALREIAAGTVRFREDIYETVVKAKGNVMPPPRSHSIPHDDAPGDVEELDNGASLI